MGRRPNAAKIEEKIRAEAQPGISNPPHEQAKSHPGIEKSSMEQVGFQPKLNASSANSALPKRKKVKKHTASIRRSERLQNSVTPTHNSDIDLVIEEITLSESEKEDEQVIHSEKELLEQPIIAEKSLEEKVSYLVQLMEAQKSNIETMNSKVIKNTFQGEERPCSTDLTYKSLYFDARKKIESLENQNNKLQNELDLTVSKLEAYEKGTRGLTEMFEKLKDVILVSNLARATEKAVNVSQICGGVSSLDADHEPVISGAKRKRLNKKN